MNLAKTSFFAIAQTVAKLLAGFIVIKIIAVLAGPVGMTDFGVYQNFSTILLMLSGGVAFTGVTKLIAGAEAQGLRPEVAYFTSNYFVTRLMYLSIFVILPIMLLVQYFYLGYSFNKIWLIAVATPFILIQARFNFFLAVLNGLEKIDLLATKNIVASMGCIALAGFTYFLFREWQAVALSLCVAPAVYFAVLVFKKETIPFQNVSESVDYATLSELKRYSYFGVVSAICIPVAQLIIRNSLVLKFSDHTAGIWQGLNRLSEVYLVLISSVLSIYIIPKVAAARSREAICDIVKKTLYYTLLISLALVGVVFFLKDFLITVLFNKSFIEMNSLFIYQLPGDFFKIVSWVFSFVILAKGHIKQIILLEVISSAIYLTLSILLIGQMGLVGSVIAYTISYGLYLIMTFSFFYLNSRKV